MQGIMRNLHWIIIFIALGRFGYTYYEYYEEENAHTEVLDKSRTDLAKSEKTKRDIKQYLNNIEKEKAKIERVAQEIERTQQLLPSEISDSENINLLRKMAEDVNIKEISIMPDADENRGFLIARKYKFKAKATYLQLLIMFEKISESKRILNVAEVHFRKLEVPQRSKFQLIDGEFNLEAYKYNASFKEDRGIEQLEKKFNSQAEETKAKTKKPRKPKAGSEES
jgi:Tfp pilus assembly protein PilO